MMMAVTRRAMRILEMMTQGMTMEAMTAAVMKANKTNANLVPSSTTSRRHLASTRSLQYF
jgi:hypothetical protein